MTAPEALNPTKYTPSMAMMELQQFMNVYQSGSGDNSLIQNIAPYMEDTGPIDEGLRFSHRFTDGRVAVLAAPGCRVRAILEQSGTDTEEFRLYSHRIMINTDSYGYVEQDASLTEYSVTGSQDLTRTIVLADVLEAEEILQFSSANNFKPKSSVLPLGMSVLEVVKTGYIGDEYYGSPYRGAVLSETGQRLIEDTDDIARHMMVALKSVGMTMQQLRKLQISELGNSYIPAWWSIIGRPLVRGSGIH